MNQELSEILTEIVNIKIQGQMFFYKDKIQLYIKTEEEKIKEIENILKEKGYKECIKIKEENMTTKIYKKGEKIISIIEKEKSTEINIYY
jgi:hypothetical protein